MKPTITWILIADGAQARVVEHSGPGKGLSQVQDLVFAGPRRKASEIMADRPGRSFASAGTKRSAMEPRTDPVEHEEAEFVRGLADELEQKRAQGAFQRLIIAAAPNALGDLRPALSDAVRQTVVAELPKDLTNVPTPQLDRHFGDLLAV